MKKIDWITFSYIGGYHVALFTTLPLYFSQQLPSFGLIVSMIVLIFACGIAITAGYHRCFSHPTYKTNPLIETVFLFFGTLATQGSALRWAYDHRIHHAHVDEEKDPYSVTKGFWHAHVLWLFTKRQPIENRVISDLWRNPLINFQHRFYVPLLIATNFFVIWVFSALFQDLFGAIVFGFLLRTFCVHHSTWFINSLAHTWGTQNFSKEHSAVDNFLISLLTFGEGYHNYHHTFANDYRNGIHWYHYDPTKWLIFLLSKLGLAHNLRRMHHDKVQLQMILEHKKELLKNLTQSFANSKEELVDKVHNQAEILMGTLRDLIEKGRKYRELTPDFSELKVHLKKEMHQLKEQLQYEWKNWDNLSDYIQKLKKFA